MPRSRIEGLLSAFPKLIGSQGQHTFVETDSVRYVYQPLEDLYMVLVTNKTSNILQDIETLSLFARLVPEYCRSNTEREVSRNAFDLIMIFDEVISLGYRENVDLSKIRTIMAMESQEERIQAEIEKTKEREAKEELKRKAKMMEMQKREAMKRGGYAGGSSSQYGGFSSQYGGFGGSSGMESSGMGSSMGANTHSASPKSFNNPEPYNNNASQGYSAGAAPSRGRGMQLGKKSATNDLLNTIKAEEGIPDQPLSISMTSKSAMNTQHTTTMAPVNTALSPTEGIQIVLEEKISLTANKDGGLTNMEIKGSMMLRINDPAKSQCSLKLHLVQDPSVQYMTHPKVDKQAFLSDALLKLRDGSSGFPVGQSLGILKWRCTTKEESRMPLTVYCWPSPNGNGSCDVNIEYGLQTDKELYDVSIVIPFPGPGMPSIGQVDGEYSVDPRKRCVVWTIPLLDSSNSSGMLEFSVQSEDLSAFYPIQVSFLSKSLFCDVEIEQITNVTTGSVLDYTAEKSLGTESYVVA